MTNKKSTTLSSRIDIEAKEKLEAIKDETNEEITPRYILEQFVKDYCSTTPKGVNIKIKELETKIKEKENQISIIKKEIIELKIEKKTYKDKLNKTLDDSYIDENLINAVESMINICEDQNYKSLDEIPEPILRKIANENKVKLGTLKIELEKKYFSKERKYKK